MHSATAIRINCFYNTQCTQMKEVHGFTLLELCMVLIIVALVIGGVIVGRDLIIAAESRRMATQMERIEQAVLMFDIKYACKPGDCLNASVFNLGTSGNGDGNLGSIDQWNDPVGGCVYSGSGCRTITPQGSVVWPFLSRATGEIQRFWVHLGNSGLLTQTFTETTVDNSPVSQAQMQAHFPRDALNKAHITPLMWGTKVYLRTGLVELDSSAKRALFKQAVLTSTHMQQITNKLGLQPNAAHTGYYPNMMRDGHKVLPDGIDTSTDAYSMYFFGPTRALPSNIYLPCVTTVGANTVYNPEGNGSCNMFWEINY